MNESYDPTHYSFGRNLLQDIANTLVQSAIIYGAERAMLKEDMKAAKVKRNNIGYLRDYRIEPNSAICGYALLKFRKASNFVFINLPINGKIYNFAWEASNIKMIKK